jgi:hypothetical protein
VRQRETRALSSPQLTACGMTLTIDLQDDPLGWSCGLTSQSPLRRLPAEWTRVERCWAAVHDERADDTSAGRHIYAGVGVQVVGGNLSSTASVRIESKPALMVSLEATFTARGTHIFPSNCKDPPSSAERCGCRRSGVSQPDGQRHTGPAAGDVSSRTPRGWKPGSTAPIGQGYAHQMNWAPGGGTRSADTWPYTVTRQ